MANVLPAPLLLRTSLLYSQISSGVGLYLNDYSFPPFRLHLQPTLLPLHIVQVSIVSTGSLVGLPTVLPSSLHVRVSPLRWVKCQSYRALPEYRVIFDSLDRNCSCGTDAGASTYGSSLLNIQLLLNNLQTEHWCIRLLNLFCTFIIICFIIQFFNHLFIVL